MEEVSSIKDDHLKLTQHIAKYQVRKKGIEDSERDIHEDQKCQLPNFRQ